MLDKSVLIVAQTGVSILIIALIYYGLRHLCTNFQMQITSKTMLCFYFISMCSLSILLVNIWLTKVGPLAIQSSIW
jgi:hypothetical protein